MGAKAKKKAFTPEQIIGISRAKEILLVQGNTGEEVTKKPEDFRVDLQPVANRVRWRSMLI